MDWLFDQICKIKNSEALSVVPEDRITCEFVESQYKIPVDTFLFLLFFKSSYLMCTCSVFYIDS
jgi:hypothetical protein